MSRSSRGSRPIYGLPKKKDTRCICVPEVSPLVGLIALKRVLDNLEIIIDRFYNTSFGIAPVVANMTMRGFVSTPVFMRLRWIDENPGVKFDKMNLVHRDGLKFIYNINNRDWRLDPLFKVLS
jgi:hypothetical protein